MKQLLEMARKTEDKDKDLLKTDSVQDLLREKYNHRPHRRQISLTSGSC
jgi:hypothetical protein